MCSPAHCDCVAKNPLSLRKPRWVKVTPIYGLVWGVVEKSRANQLSFSAERAGGARFHNFLVGALRHPQLPGHPLDGSLGGALLTPLVHDAKQAYGWH